MQPTDNSEFKKRLSRIHERRVQEFQSFGPHQNISWGLETRTPPERYEWDGRKRGASPAHPKLLFQFTLAGSGNYIETGKHFTVGPGYAFLAVIPSNHVYLRPKSIASWTFFWFMIEHPMLVERGRELRRNEAAVQAWPVNSAGLQRAVTLWESACRGELRDGWVFEEQLFGWLIAMERDLHERRYPQRDRERLLLETRRFVERDLSRTPGVNDLAAEHGLERTTFSRFFKQKTGTTPAAYVLEVRMEHAMRLLRTRAKLEDVAAKTGFADANHFCKVFRAHYATSPGIYRKLFLK